MSSLHVQVFFARLLRDSAARQFAACPDILGCEGKYRRVPHAQWDMGLLKWGAPRPSGRPPGNGKLADLEVLLGASRCGLGRRTRLEGIAGSAALALEMPQTSEVL